MTTEKQELTPLGRIEAFLKEKDYLVRLEPTLQGKEFEQLYVGLFQDKKQRTYIMEMVFINDFSKILELEEEPAEEPGLSLLQFYSVFPFTINEFARGEVGRVLHFINQFLPLGTFGCVEAARTIYYRYVHASESAAMASLPVVQEVLNIAEGAMDRLSPLFEQVGEMQLTSAEAIEQIGQRGIF